MSEAGTDERDYFRTRRARANEREQPEEPSNPSWSCVSASMPGLRMTVAISSIPLTAVAQELFDFFEAIVGSVFAVEIFTARKNWRSKGVGRVQFDTVVAAEEAMRLHAEGRLEEFQCVRLVLSRPLDDIVVRPAEPRNRVKGATLRVGFLVGEREMVALEDWGNTSVALMPERSTVELLLEHGGEQYKMKTMFGDVDGSFLCSVHGRKENAILLKLKFMPRIYHRISGPTLTPKFKSDRYHVYQEDFQFHWVRTVDFSASCSIGQSSYFCLELPEESSASDILKNFPFVEALGDLHIRRGKAVYASSKLCPLVNSLSDPPLAFEVIFQLNSLVQAQKVSLGQVNIELFRKLNSIGADASKQIFLKLHKRNSLCYDPVKFINDHWAETQQIQRNFPSAVHNSLETKNLMHCYRSLITPSKLYLKGPEIETSNYVVKHFASYCSDFLRITFVEEDWSKLPSDAISTKIEEGAFAGPYRTRIYTRILSILKEGITIGEKKFEFLAFSASQLRGNSVWMFASNDAVTAAKIRDWMGSFNKIRSVSKCAARMGQLFSSSVQTLNVPCQEVEMINDVEVVTDGIKYCFSDGIGKISLSFARQVAYKCGLSHIPSAFQIRYGGYKGVIAVDRTSFWKLSLRKSMQKFDSMNTMLNVTKWSESMPCYLNREIICLLSTLGVEDERFEDLQRQHIHELDEMLTKREMALKIVDCMGGVDTRTIMKMLMQGYEPNAEPYLSMLLKAHHEYLLSDIRGKCRIFVPKGRVLIGCLDETNTLSYGQVYVRVTMTNTELQDGDQPFFRRIDRTTAVLIGKVIVTKNPCLHPGDIRVLDVVDQLMIEERGLIDCIIFPQKGQRPHPNECSGGDLDGDLYFVSWDENLLPPTTVKPMDYIARRSHFMDHDVTLEEIQKFFIDYMINDTLGIISNSHLVHADRDPRRARSSTCLELAKLHSMAVDFAKTGAPAEMPMKLRPKEYPDFMERWDRPVYISDGVFGKLYRGISNHSRHKNSCSIPPMQVAYDQDLEVEGFVAFLDVAKNFRDQYAEKLSSLMHYYGAVSEDEILTGNLRFRSTYLQKDKKRYSDMKDRIILSVKNLRGVVEGWFRDCCCQEDQPRMASAWYHVTYHPDHYSELNFLSFPWILCDVLLSIKSRKGLQR